MGERDKGWAAVEYGKGPREAIRPIQKKKTPEGGGGRDAPIHDRRTRGSNQGVDAGGFKKRKGTHVKNRYAGKGQPGMLEVVPEMVGEVDGEKVRKERKREHGLRGSRSSSPPILTVGGPATTIKIPKRKASYTFDGGSLR